MRFLIDITDASGVKQGPGPLNTGVRWEHTRRLSRAGAFSLELGANARAAEIQHKRRLVCTGLLNGAPAEFGAGIVDEIEKPQAGDGRVTIIARGDDLLRELAYTHVGALRIADSDSTLLPDKAIRHNPSTGADTDLVTGSPITLLTSQYIYVGYSEPFDAWTPTISTGNVNAATLTAQYPSDQQEGDWTNITITDGTLSAGKTLAVTGTISWTRPDDWKRQRHGTDNLYWVRFYPSASLSAATFTKNEITGDSPAVTGPDDIMAFAASGWSLDLTNGYDETLIAITHTFKRETVLAALIVLAEKTGEWFRLGDGRKLIWMQTDTPDSGIRAVRGTGDEQIYDRAELCIINEISETTDTYENYVGRLYADGAEGISLKDYAGSVASGYAISSDSRGYYLQHTATWSSYGIEVAKTFSQALTPDELYQTAYEYLRLRKSAYARYSLRVVGLNQIVYPGQAIHIEYRRIIDGWKAFDINGDFVIIAATTTIDGDGLRVDALDIASDPRYPDTSIEALAELL